MVLCGLVGSVGTVASIILVKLARRYGNAYEDIK